MFNASACLFCKEFIKNNAIFCHECYLHIHFIGQACDFCGIILDKHLAENNFSLCHACLFEKTKWHLSSIRSLFLYQDFGKKIILMLKRKNDEYLYKILARLAFANHSNYLKNIDFIIPIPLHWIKKFLRGFNQAHLLAEMINQLLALPISNNILKRIKNTESQIQKSKKERVRNVKNAFNINDCDLMGKNILLIDDVVTSGATANECARILKKYGANEVKLLTIARAHQYHI